MISYVSCDAVEDDLIHRAFSVGFSDYLVNMNFSEGEFIQRFFGPEGNKREFSHLALDKGRPVGLILGGMKEYEGINTLRCGTLCVDPDYRRAGVAQSLFDLHQSIGVQQGCQQLFLEVITGNEKAIRFYEKQGYEKRYDLHLYVLEDGLQIAFTNPLSSEISPIGLEQIQKIRYEIDVHLNWQNDIEFLEQSKHQYHYGLFAKQQVVGVLSINDSGRISFLWVDRSYRQKGMAAYLLNFAVRELNLQKLSTSFPNHGNLEGFYKRMGFRRATISQLEMYKMLP
ncbi:GNAT family N-acetyltransferase [Ammoniphilus sp. YIM 78166]|uniref:GNAT family N-acetyltransferase n=1 Tax=Ammoniphilus sp. YIM 78166 TaxID=1644106 RepID=UPI00106F5018|nr:GNAT family N-acetyltransferase [Ammoniphilus sp. YIM 78166]